MKKQPTQTGVWLDGKKAVIIDLVNGQETIREVIADIDNAVHHKHQGKPGTFMGSQHVNDEKKFESKKSHETHQYLTRIIDEIHDTDEIYILGPSEMKTALRKIIEEDKNFKKKLKGVESSDYITLNQAVAEVKRYFKEAE